MILNVRTLLLLVLRGFSLFAMRLQFGLLDQVNGYRVGEHQMAQYHSAEYHVA